MTRFGTVSLGLLPLVFFLSACFPLLPSAGGGQTDFSPPRLLNAADIALPAGYRAELVASGLTFPTGIVFDEAGGMFVLEAGYSYGEVFTIPRLLEILPDGSTRLVVSGDNGPWNGVAYHKGHFYIVGGHVGGGQILRVDRAGEVTVLLENLPSYGDHHTNAPVVADGYLYFAQGTATNSAVVGVDNADFGWLSREPDFHDIPCQDVTLSGRNYITPDPLNGGEATTGAFVPFGTRTTGGQVIPGGLPCNGAIMRLPLAGGELELVAWGFRNPFGLAFAPDGTLYTVNNEYDRRGSRPVFGAGDTVWCVSPGTWYGWPDFHGVRPMTDANHFRDLGHAEPGFLLASHPNLPPEPLAILAVHSSSNGLDVAPAAFGYEGDLFIAQFGDMAPQVGKVLNPVGYRVVRVDPQTGISSDFAINREPYGPASKVGGGGLERPVSVRFAPDGSLYIVDFGVMTMGAAGPEPRLGTGVIWRVVREGL